MSVILITENFKFRNRSKCSKEPMKRAVKICGDSQDLKSPGCFIVRIHLLLLIENIDLAECEGDERRTIG